MFKQMNARVSPILEDALLVIHMGTNSNPSLSQVDVNDLAKEQTELANYLAYACSLRALAVEEALYGGDFVTMIFPNWRTQRF